MNLNDGNESGFVATYKDSYPVHRLCPSIHWRMCIFHWSCYRWLRSDTSSAADSLLHKIQQGILGEKNTQKALLQPFIYLLYRPSLCSVLCTLTCCAVGPSPAWRAHTLPAGRVADATVTAATGLVTSFSIEMSWAGCQGKDKQYHYLLMNSPDQTWKFQCLVSDTLQATAWGTSSRYFLMRDRAGFSQISMKPSVVLFHCESAL